MGTDMVTYVIIVHFTEHGQVLHLPDLAHHFLSNFLSRPPMPSSLSSVHSPPTIPSTTTYSGRRHLIASLLHTMSSPFPHLSRLPTPSCLSFTGFAPAILSTAYPACQHLIASLLHVPRLLLPHNAHSLHCQDTANHLLSNHWTGGSEGSVKG
jgi:hypothetical protein